MQLVNLKNFLFFPFAAITAICCYYNKLPTASHAPLRKQSSNNNIIGRRLDIVMLLLDYKVYKSLPENKRVLHLLQWLQNLPKTIDAAEKVCWCVSFRIIR